MGRSRGRRYDYDAEPKLNIKKVIGCILVLVLIIFIIVELKSLLTKKDKNKDTSSLTTYFAVVEDGLWGVIDNKGNRIIDNNYEDMIIIPNKNQPVFICSYDNNYDTESYKTAVFNAKEEEIFSEYESVLPIENTDGSKVFYDQNALIYSKDGKKGLISFEGKELTPAEYDNLYALSGVEKSIVAEVSGKVGLINSSNGEVIIPVQYSNIESLSDNYDDGYIVQNDAAKYGLIGVDKAEVLPTKYDEIKKVSSKSYYVVVENGTLEIVDNKGKVILNSGFDTVEGIGVDSFVIMKNNKYGVINIEGNAVIPTDYENVKIAQKGYYIVQKDNKYGVINENQEYVIPSEYTKITYVPEGSFYTCEKEDFTTDVFDQNVAKVLDSVIISDLNTEIGYLRVRKENAYKYYNFKFEEKTNKDILSTNTLFLVQENGKYGYENKDGERIVDCIYDDAKEQNEFGYCAVNKDGKWGALKADGTVIVEPERDLSNYLFIDFIYQYNRYNDLSIEVYEK